MQILVSILMDNCYFAQINWNELNNPKFLFLFLTWNHYEISNMERRYPGLSLSTLLKYANSGALEVWLVVWRPASGLPVVSPPLHCGKYRGVMVRKVYSMLGDYKKYFFFAQTYLFLMGNIFGKINFFQKNFPKKILEIFFWKFLGNFFFFPKNLPLKK